MQRRRKPIESRGRLDIRNFDKQLDKKITHARTTYIILKSSINLQINFTKKRSFLGSTPPLYRYKRVCENPNIIKFNELMNT